MISISTQTQQADGTITIYEKATTVLRDTAARVSRTACLDGTAEITHNGTSEGDRIFRVYSDVTEAEAQTLWDNYDLGVNVYMACSEGFFLGAISRLKVDNGDMVLEFLVKEKKSS